MTGEAFQDINVRYHVHCRKESYSRINTVQFVPTGGLPSDQRPADSLRVKVKYIELVAGPISRIGWMVADINALPCSDRNESDGCGIGDGLN